MEIISLIQPYFFIAFVLAIFSDDLEKESEVSPFIWIALIWMILGTVRSVSYWLHPVSTMHDLEFDVEAGSPVDRLVSIGLMAMGMAVLWIRRVRVLPLLKANPWFLVLYIYMGLSIVWSDFGGVSFRRWFRSLGTLMMVCLVLTELNPAEAVKRMFIRFVGILVPLSIIFIYFVPQLGMMNTSGGEAMVVGVTYHKNGLGQLCAVSGLFLLWMIALKSGRRVSERNKIHELIQYALLSACLWLLFLVGNARSITAIIAFAGGVACLFGISTFKSRPWSITLLAMFLGLMLLAFWEQGQDYFFSIAGRDTSLTGRVDLWGDLIAIGSRNILAGKGFGGFWVGDSAHNLWDTYTFRPNQGHNGYIDVFVDLGLIGLVILGGVIVAAFRNAWRTIGRNDVFGSLQFAFLFMICLNNLGESTIIKTSALLWFLFLLFGMKFQRSAQQ